MVEDLAPESIDRIDVNFSWAQQVRIAEPVTTVSFAKSAADPIVGLRRKRAATHVADQPPETNGSRIHVEDPG